MIPARGYLVGLSIRLTPLTDPDYRPFSRRIAWLAADDSMGAIVDFTELVVPGDGKGDAQHYGTAVLPGHRGHGLALWMKAEQILQTRIHFPDLDALLTDTVDTNTPMRRTNTHLGYKPTAAIHRRTLDLCTY